MTSSASNTPQDFFLSPYFSPREEYRQLELQALNQGQKKVADFCAEKITELNFYQDYLGKVLETMEKSRSQDLNQVLQLQHKIQENEQHIPAVREMLTMKPDSQDEMEKVDARAKCFIKMSVAPRYRTKPNFIIIQPDTVIKLLPTFSVNNGPIIDLNDIDSVIDVARQIYAVSINRYPDSALQSDDPDQAELLEKFKKYRYHAAIALSIKYLADTPIKFRFLFSEIINDNKLTKSIPSKDFNSLERIFLHSTDFRFPLELTSSEKSEDKEASTPSIATEDPNSASREQEVSICSEFTPDSSFLTLSLDSPPDSPWKFALSPAVGDEGLNY